MTAYVMRLEIGCYVVTRSRGRGRIVDARRPDRITQYLVKFTTGELLWMGAEHLTRVDQ